MKRLALTVATALVMFVCPLVFADETDLRPVDQSSANFGKSAEFLPGEEVVTPTGKKMKVWSTKGPVPVSQAPQPFEDREKSVLDDIPVVIDAEVDDPRNRQTREEFDMRRVPDNGRR